MNTGHCKGQAIAEYLIVAAVLALALFLPFLNGDSVAVLLARSLFVYFRAMSFIVSIL
jgi:hypothetical protein